VISCVRPTKTPTARRARDFASWGATGAARAEEEARFARAFWTAAALCGRSSGVLASKCKIRFSRAWGSSGLCQEGATGGVLMCWERMAASWSPRNGGLPATISYKVAPRE